MNITRTCNTCQKSFEIDIENATSDDIQVCCCSDKCLKTYENTLGKCSFCGTEIPNTGKQCDHLFFAFDKYCRPTCRENDIKRFVRMLHIGFKDSGKLRKRFLELLSAHTTLLIALKEEIESLQDTQE